MLDALQKPILQLLRVPAEPQAPLGDPRSVQVFRAARGFYFYRLLQWSSKQVGAIAGLIFGLVALRFVPAEIPDLPDRVPGIVRSILEGFNMLEAIELVAIAFFLLQLPVSWFLLSLDYRYRWYVITDRSLRIREGLFKIQERTMTFSNIQNVEIRQGPIQRLLGIADLKVQTAGGGGKGDDDDEKESMANNLHIGYFRGVSNADEIRDVLQGYLRRVRASGLGNPDEPTVGVAPALEVAREAPDSAPELAAGFASGAAEGAEVGVLDAARDVLRETRALAQAVSPS